MRKAFQKEASMDKKSKQRCTRKQGKRKETDETRRVSNFLFKQLCSSSSTRSGGSRSSARSGAGSGSGTRSGAGSGSGTRARARGSSARRGTSSSGWGSSGASAGSALRSTASGDGGLEKLRSSSIVDGQSLGLAAMMTLARRRGDDVRIVGGRGTLSLPLSVPDVGALPRDGGGGGDDGGGGGGSGGSGLPSDLLLAVLARGGSVGGGGLAALALGGRLWLRLGFRFGEVGDFGAAIDAVDVHGAGHVDGVLGLRVTDDVVLGNEFLENSLPLPVLLLGELPGDLLKISHGVGLHGGEGGRKAGGGVFGGFKGQAVGGDVHEILELCAGGEEVVEGGLIADGLELRIVLDSNHGGLSPTGDGHGTTREQPQLTRGGWFLRSLLGALLGVLLGTLLQTRFGTLLGSGRSLQRSRIVVVVVGVVDVDGLGGAAASEVAPALHEDRFDDLPCYPISFESTQEWERLPHLVN